MNSYTNSCIRIALLTIATALMITGCQRPDTGDKVATKPTTEPEMTESSPVNLTLEQAVAAAREDLRQRLDAAPESIELVEARPVTWPNGALGCPEEGMMYTQALVDGFYIHLRAGVEDAYYHAGRDGRPLHCPAERSQNPPSRASHTI